MAATVATAEMEGMAEMVEMEEEMVATDPLYMRVRNVGMEKSKTGKLLHLPWLMVSSSLQQKQECHA